MNIRLLVTTRYRPWIPWEPMSGSKVVQDQSLLVISHCVSVTPNGHYISFSFGASGTSWKWGLTGQVYQDTELGGEIVEDSYYKTSKKVDARIKKLLRKLIGSKYYYRLFNRNCRWWSQTQFKFIAKELEKHKKGTKTKPPKRKPRKQANVGGLPGVTQPARPFSRATSGPTTTTVEPSTSSTGATGSTSKPSSTVPSTPVPSTSSSSAEK